MHSGNEGTRGKGKKREGAGRKKTPVWRVVAPNGKQPDAVEHQSGTKLRTGSGEEKSAGAQKHAPGKRKQGTRAAVNSSAIESSKEASRQEALGADDAEQDRVEAAREDVVNAQAVLDELENTPEGPAPLFEREEKWMVDDDVDGFFRVQWEHEDQTDPPTVPVRYREASKWKWLFLTFVGFLVFNYIIVPLYDRATLTHALEEEAYGRRYALLSALAAITTYITMTRPVVRVSKWRRVRRFKSLAQYGQNGRAIRSNGVEYWLENDARNDIARRGELLHKEALYMRVQLVDRIFWDFDGDTLTEDVVVGKTMMISLELLRQITIPANVSLLSTEELCIGRIEKSANTNTSVNVSRKLNVTRECVVQNTILVAVGVMKQIRSNTTHAHFLLAPALVATSVKSESCMAIEPARLVCQNFQRSDPALKSEKRGLLIRFFEFLSECHSD